MQRVRETARYNVVDDVVVGRKDPEDEDHPDCVPIREEEVTATALEGVYS